MPGRRRRRTASHTETPVDEIHPSNSELITSPANQYSDSSSSSSEDNTLKYEILKIKLHEQKKRRRLEKELHETRITLLRAKAEKETIQKPSSAARSMRSIRSMRSLKKFMQTTYPLGRMKALRARLVRALGDDGPLAHLRGVPFSVLTDENLIELLQISINNHIQDTIPGTEGAKKTVIEKGPDAGLILEDLYGATHENTQDMMPRLLVYIHSIWPTINKSNQSVALPKDQKGRILEFIRDQKTFLEALCAQRRYEL